MSNSIKIIHKADHCKLDGKFFKSLNGYVNLDEDNSSNTIKEVLRGEHMLDDIKFDNNGHMTLEFVSHSKKESNYG